MVETFIEFTNNDIVARIKKLNLQKYLNLSERKQKELEESEIKKLVVRDDIVNTNVDKGDAVIMLDMKD